MKSFRNKLTVIFIASMLFIGAMNNFLIYRYSLKSQFNSLRNKLKIIAQISTLAIDADLIEQIPLNPEGVNSSQYKALRDKLNKIIEINRPVKYIYLLKKTADKGVWQFIIDIDLPKKEEKSRRKIALPGSLYNAARFPQMLNAYNGPAADEKLEIDEWGITLSGYAPVIDKDGRILAVLGVDIMADDVYKMQRVVFHRAIFVLLLGLVLSVILAVFISKRVTDPVKKLVDGTRHIADGNLSYRIDIKGEDEMSQLAGAFNKMAMSLAESRKKLLGYFYRVVQSLVRILEAKDNYTKGHSERVAEYAQKIAQKMGFSEEKVELLKEVTLLHDIGKIGVDEAILNKQGQLDSQEWELIKKHSLIGEDILKPIFLSDEMLEIVRAHHERYDGKGYPDKLSGVHISIFAAIVSVADAYDAMTSSRAYRAALSKEEAIEELKRNKGTQFNPKVVDIFIEILQQET